MSLIIHSISALLLIINFPACGDLPHGSLQTLGISLGNLCHRGKLCKYDYGDGYKGEAQCGVLIANFRKSWKDGQAQPSKFHPSLKELVKKQKAVIQQEDVDLGRMVLCYNDSSAEAISSKKKQLEKHPAVYFVTYNMPVQFDSKKDVVRD